MKTIRPLALIFTIFLGFSQAVLAQSTLQVDSIHVFSLLHAAEEKSAQAEYEVAHELCEQAILYSRMRNYAYGMAFAYIRQAELYMDSDDLNQAKNYADKTEILANKLGDKQIQAISDLLFAQILMYNDKPRESFPFFEKSISGYFERHASAYAALAYNDYGYALGMNGETDKQIANLIQALKILEAVSPDNAAELAVTLNNISIAYYGMGNTEKAIEYALRSLAYRKLAGDLNKMALGCCNLSQFYRGIDQAMVEKYLKECENYAEQSGDEARMIQAYVTSALLFSDRGEREKAMTYEEKVIDLLLKNQQNPSMLARRYLSLAMHAVALKKDSLTVMQYFDKSLQLTRGNHDKVNFRDLYQQLSLFYRNRNDFRRAYDFYHLHILYRDSIINEHTLSNIAELEKKYETEKKDNEILRLGNSEQLKELEIARQKVILSSNLLEAERKEKAIGLLTRTQELHKLKILQQNEELIKRDLLAKNNGQQLELAEKEKLLQERQLKNGRILRNISYLGFVVLALIGYFLFIRYQLKRKILEQEALLIVRGDIARDLHDEIGSTLTSINILSQVSSRQVSNSLPNISPYLAKITQQSAEAQQGISDIVWAVNPENDKLGNLASRMREYVARTLEPKNVQIDMKIDEQILNTHIAMNQRRDFLLIFKEVINNIAKHAGASNVNITLSQKNQLLELYISDNGNGFDTRATFTSSGLNNLYNRAKAMNGIFALSSYPGRGTTIEMRFPAT